MRLQLLAGVKQPGPNSPDVAVHDFCDFFMRRTLHIVQCDDQSMGFRQLLHCFVQFFLQFSQVDVPPRSFLRNQGDEVGVIPAGDYDFLRAAGVGAVFGPGSNIPRAASEILALVRERRAAA